MVSSRRLSWRLDRLLLVLVGLMALVLPPAPRTLAQAAGTDYYLSASGDDASPGTSPAVAWRTLGRANRARLQAGDRLLLEGGATFPGSLTLAASGGGTPDRPITVSSYGGGRATIAAGKRAGIVIQDRAGFVISALNVFGERRTANNGSGIVFTTTLDGNRKLERVTIRDVEVAEFGEYGITIGGWNGTTGYRDVTITNAVVHDNSKGGIVTYGERMYANENVYVGDSRAYDNPGIPGLDINSGSGIVLGSVNGGVIERSIARGNGWLSDATAGGPVGIWAYDANGVTIQFNESYGNSTAGPVDGGGFDLDQNTSNSVLQYNYSHGNQGSGFLLAQTPTTQQHSGNVVRYNVSEQDARRNPTHAGIQVWGQVRNADIYNNTVYVGPASDGTAHALAIDAPKKSPGATGIRVLNNIFQTTDGVALLEVGPNGLEPRSTFLFQANDYYPSGGSFRLAWGGRVFEDLDAWRAATGQEPAGATAAGRSIDPQLANPGGGGTMDNPDLLASLSSYRLQDSSPLVGAGLDLAATFGLDPGRRDFYGQALPASGPLSIGAHEGRSTAGATTDRPMAAGPLPPSSP